VAAEFQPWPYEPWPVLSREPAGFWEDWPYQPVGYGNPGVACELEVRSSLGFGALILFVYVEVP
jgi:hypothetical protein